MEVTINNSPIHSQTIITYPYGIEDVSYTFGYHTGLDFAPFGETEREPFLYPVTNGKVYLVDTTGLGSLGIQVLIKDDFGRFWRYCHMKPGSVLVNIGDRVSIDTKLGRMGASGNVTGIHLHLEYSETPFWSDNRFLNPCTFLNIPNIDNTIINYKATKIERKRHFNWAVYIRKLRSGRRW